MRRWNIIGIAIVYGILGVILALVWSQAIGFKLSTGLLIGGIVGVVVPTIQAMFLYQDAIRGMTMMYGGIWFLLLVIGLGIWLFGAIL